MDLEDDGRGEGALTLRKYFTSRMRAAEPEDQDAGGTNEPEKRTKSHDLNYGRLRENAHTAI